MANPGATEIPAFCFWTWWVAIVLIMQLTDVCILYASKAKQRDDNAIFMLFFTKAAALSVFASAEWQVAGSHTCMIVVICMMVFLKGSGSTFLIYRWLRS